MLRLTRTAIGLLTAQYRSVLHKCWMINVGLFVIGAATTLMSSTAAAGTIDEVFEKVVKNSSVGAHLLQGGYSSYITPFSNEVGMSLNGVYYTFVPNESSEEKNRIMRLMGHLAMYSDGALYLSTFAPNNGTPLYVFDDGTHHWATGSGLSIGSSYGLKSMYDVVAENSNSGVGIYSKRYVKNADGDYSISGYNRYDFKSKESYGPTDSSWKYYNLAKDSNNIISLTSTGASSSDYDYRIRGVSHERISSGQSGANITGSFFFLTDSAIYSAGTIGDIYSDFIMNSTNNSYGGGAIYSTTIQDIVGNFISNSASGVYGGGAISGGTIGNIHGSFFYNSASNPYGQTSGGAIGGYSNTYIGNIVGDFIGNSANVDYTQNSNAMLSANGGAIVNAIFYGIVGDFISNYAQATGPTISSVNARGGAISYRGQGSDIIGNMTDNYVIANNTSTGTAVAVGGAIHHYGASSSGTSRFYGDLIGNYAKAMSSATGSAVAMGGAIHKEGNVTLSIYDAEVIYNSVEGTSAMTNGGAIYNDYGGVENVTYNSGSDISVIAQLEDVVFYNNTVKVGSNTPVYNDIYQGYGTRANYASNYASYAVSQGRIGLNATSGHSISFGGTIDGDSSYVEKNILNINQDEFDYGGEYIFNNAVKNHTINLGSSANEEREALISLGKIKQADGTTTYGTIQNSTITNNAAARIDMQNSYAGSEQVNDITSLTLNQNLKLGIDVALSGATGTADKLGATTITGNGKVIIDSINVANKYTDSGKTATVNILSSADIATGKYTLADSDVLNLVKGNNYYTQIEYNSETGDLVFSDKLINESALNEALEDISGGSSIQKVIIGSGAVTPDASTGELTPDENKAITLGAAAARGVATSVTSSSTDDSLATAKAVYSFVNGSYVAKVDGKGLSTNDFTTALKNKLDGIATATTVASGGTGYVTSGLLFNQGYFQASNIISSSASTAASDSNVYSAKKVDTLLGSYLTTTTASSTYQPIINSSNKLAVSNIDGLAKVATSGSYSDLSNKPTIPTVNNATLTIQRQENGGTASNIGTFTANASSGSTIIFNDTNTHDTAHLYVGAQNATANSAQTANGNVYLTLTDNSNANKHSYKITGAGGTTVTSDANGTITITGATDTNTTYSAGTGLSLNGTTFSVSGLKDAQIADNAGIALSKLAAQSNKGYALVTNATSGAIETRGISSSIAAASTSTNLVTAQAVASFVEGKGYKTTDNDTHWTTHLYAGDGTNANKATSNGSTKIALYDNTVAREAITIKGTGATTVTSDANGVITINSTDNNTTYSAGNGITISGSGNPIAIKLATSSGLYVDGNGLKVSGITNDHISSSAAIATSKLALNSGTANNVLYYGSGGTLTSGQIANAQIASNAAIASSKISFTDTQTAVFGSGITSGKVSNYDTAYTAAVTNKTTSVTSNNTNLISSAGVYSNAARALYETNPSTAYANGTIGKAISDSIKGLSVSGTTITYTKGDGTKGTITTQDNNTTYTNGTGLSLNGTTFALSNLTQHNLLSSTTAGNGLTITAGTASDNAQIALKLKNSGGLAADTNGLYVTGVTKSQLDDAVQTSLGKADSALQSHQTVTLASGTNNGTVKLTVGGTETDNIAVKGLKSAAFAETSAFDAAGAASGVQTAIETNFGKGGAGGYDINANSLQVRGTDVVTTARKINNQDLSRDVTLYGSNITLDASSYSTGTGNVAKTDTITTAIGKVEGKANTANTAISNAIVAKANITSGNDSKLITSGAVRGALGFTIGDTANHTGNNPVYTSIADYVDINGGKIDSIAIADNNAAGTMKSGSNTIFDISNKTMTLGAAAARGVDTSVTENSDKLITSGAVYGERAAIATLTNKTINADNNTISNLETDNFKSGVVDTAGIAANGNGSATALASTASVVATVNNRAQDATFTVTGTNANNYLAQQTPANVDTIKEAINSLGTGLYSANSNISTINMNISTINANIGSVEANTPYLNTTGQAKAFSSTNTVGQNLATLAGKIGTLTTTDTYRGSAGTVEGQLNNLDTAISNIVSGSTTVGKATNDSDGNAINTTYAKIAGGTTDAYQTFRGYNKFNNNVILDGGATLNASDHLYASNGTKNVVDIYADDTKGGIINVNNAGGTTNIKLDGTNGRFYLGGTTNYVSSIDTGNAIDAAGGSENTMATTKTLGATRTAINSDIATAKSEAINAATSKANTALADAKSYADGKVAAEKTARENADSALSDRIGTWTVGNYVAASGASGTTSNVAVALKALDAGMGAKIEADGNVIKQSATNTINANIKAIDDSIGKLAALTPYINTGSNATAFSSTNTIGGKMSSLASTVSGKIGSWTAGNYMTAATAGNTNVTIGAQLQALDTAMGKQLADGNYIKASVTATGQNNLAQNIAALDTQLGASSEITSHNYIAQNGHVNANLSALDTRLKSVSDNYVTTNTVQDITETKTFKSAATGSGTDKTQYSTVLNGTTLTMNKLTGTTPTVTENIKLDGADASVSATTFKAGANTTLAQNSLVLSNGSNSTTLSANANGLNVNTGAKVNGNLSSTGTLKIGEANAITGTSGSLAFGNNNFTNVGTISSGAITSTGAISGASLSSTGDASVGGNMDIAGTLKAGTNDAFQVATGGGVTATSLNAGSGTIQTTGAVNGGTVTATTSVTTPKLVLGTTGATNELTSVDVVSSTDTTVKANNKIVATKASVDRDVKANAKNANATAGAAGTTTAGVTTIQGQLTALNDKIGTLSTMDGPYISSSATLADNINTLADKIGTANTITNTSYINGNNTVTTNLNNLAGKLGTLSTSGRNYITGSTVAGDLNALDSAIGTWNKGNNISATNKTTGSVYNVASALTSLDTTIGNVKGLTAGYFANSGDSVTDKLSALNSNISGTIGQIKANTPYLNAGNNSALAFGTGDASVGGRLSELATDIDAVLGTNYLTQYDVDNLPKDVNGKGKAFSSTTVAQNIKALDEAIGDLTTGIKKAKTDDQGQIEYDTEGKMIMIDAAKNVTDQLKALNTLVSSNQSGMTTDLAAEIASRIAGDQNLETYFVGSVKEGTYVTTYKKNDEAEAGTGEQTKRKNTNVAAQINTLDKVIGNMSSVDGSKGNISAITYTDNENTNERTITGSIAANLKSLDNAIGDRTYASHNIVTQENDVATSVSDLDAAVGAMNWNSTNGNIAKYVAAHIEDGQEVPAKGTVAQNLKQIDTNIGNLGNLTTGDGNKGNLVAAINSVLSGGAKFTGLKMASNTTSPAEVTVSKIDTGSSKYLAADGTSGANDTLATTKTVQETSKAMFAGTNTWTGANTFSSTVNMNGTVNIGDADADALNIKSKTILTEGTTNSTVIDGEDFAMYNGAYSSSAPANNRTLHLNGADGSAEFAAGKFTVGADGVVYADGTLGVKGVTTLTGALNANGGINADNGKFTVADGTGDVHTSGTLDVGSTSNFDGLATFNAGAKIVNGQALNVGDNTANSA
ncbi:MAG: hypothetical protein J6N45_08850, partial [Alphaproteobacteria bacterium]|nr:hypothetical protein [Alphaproteobacteria bacterium]